MWATRRSPHLNPEKAAGAWRVRGKDAAPATGAGLFVTFGLGEDLFGVAFGFNLAPDLGDGAVGGDEEGGALNAHDFFAVHVLFLEDAEELSDIFIGVGEEGVGERIFFLELLLRFGVSGEMPRTVSPARVSLP